MEFHSLKYNLVSGETIPHLAQKIKLKVLQDGYYLTNIGKLNDDQLIEISCHIGKLYNIKSPIISVKVDPNKFGITLTNQEVYPHNECAYSINVPNYILLFCEHSSNDGGEFYLIDSQNIMRDLGDRFHDELKKINVQINNKRNETLVKKKLITKHFMEPELDCLSYSSIYLQNNNEAYSYLAYDEEPLAIERLNKLLLNKKYRIHHKWKAGDLMIFDNFRFLHGRNSYGDTHRHLKHIRIV